MDDTEDQLDDEELDAPGDDEAPEPDEGEGDAPATTRAGRSRADGDEDVESIDQIVKKEARAGGDEDEAVLTMGREEKLEPLAVKVVPPQETEFVCTKCYLVKHRSQLKDVKRKRCRDCA
jgi:hypothetical protein